MLVTKLMLSAEEEIGPDNVPCLRNIDAIWLVTSPVLWLLANSILLIIFGGKTIVEGSNLAYVFGPCWARKWVVLIFKGSFRPKISFWSSLTSEVAKGNQIYPFYYDGVKLSTMSNCPVCCDGVKLSAVSNCPRCQIVLFAFWLHNTEFRGFCLLVSISLKVWAILLLCCTPPQPTPSLFPKRYHETGCSGSKPWGGDNHNQTLVENILRQPQSNPGWEYFERIFWDNLNPTLVDNIFLQTIEYLKNIWFQARYWEGKLREAIERASGS